MSQRYLPNPLIRQTFYKPIYLDTHRQIIGGWITTNPFMLAIPSEYRPQLVYSEFEAKCLPPGIWTVLSVPDDPFQPSVAVLTW